MLFSLAIAFVVTPWAAFRMLRWAEAPPRDARAAHEAAKASEPEDFFTRLYRRVMRPLIHSRAGATRFLASLVALLLGALALVRLRLGEGEDAALRQQERVPGHLDMPEGTTLEQTAQRGARNRGAPCADEAEVTDYEVYAGDGGAVQFQRTGAALFPAAGRERGRHPGEPAAEGRAQGAEPRDRQAGARRGWRPSRPDTARG